MDYDEELIPRSLFKLSLDVVVNNLNSFLPYSGDPVEPCTSRRRRIIIDEKNSLPLPISQSILKKSQKLWKKQKKHGADIPLLKNYVHAEAFPLTSLELSFVHVNNEPLMANLISAQQNTLKHLKLTNIEERCLATVSHLLQTGKTTTLTHLISLSLHTIFLVDPLGGPIPYSSIPPITYMCPDIKHLSLVQNFNDELENDCSTSFVTRILKPINDLLTLDLSQWSRGLSLQPVIRFGLLESLNLYNTPISDAAIFDIILMKSLRRLDISQSNSALNYKQPVSCLHALVTSLPKLEHLDISGTNLTAHSTELDKLPCGPALIKADIAGLRFLKNRLKFLGIFGCRNNRHFYDIPAEQVAGEMDEKQFLMALKMYTNRPEFIEQILRELFELYRNTDPNMNHHTEAITLLIKVLKHQKLQGIKDIGYLLLYYTIPNSQMSLKFRSKIIRCLVDGIQECIEFPEIVRICCLTLCKFEVPREILVEYSRIAELMVKVIEHKNSDRVLRRIAILIISYVVQQSQPSQKTRVGSFRAIEVALSLIRRELREANFDEALSTAWSFLWNVSDETPENSERFIDGGGLNLLRQCYNKYPNNEKLVFHMMGLIGNVSEVTYLRKKLIEDTPLMDIMRTLIHSDHQEVAYNTIGVIANITAENDKIWTFKSCSKNEMSGEIIQAMESWECGSFRCVNYNSLGPIIRLLTAKNSIGSQCWSLWTLANLTTIEHDKYCRLLVEEHGFEALDKFRKHSARFSPFMLDLEKTIRTNLRNWYIMNSYARNLYRLSVFNYNTHF